MRATVKTANLTRSRGIALIAGLLLMTSMVLLSLAIATGVLLEKRMTGNFGDSQLALKRALLAEQWGEYWLLSRPDNPLDPDCDSGCESPAIYSPGQLPDSPELEDSQWWQLNAGIAGIEPVTGLVHVDYTLPNTDAARWLIEEIHMEPLEELVVEPGSEEPTLGYYRVFGYGSGRLPGSVAVTEAIIARPWADGLGAASFPPNSEATWFCEQFADGIPCGRQGWRRRR